VAVERVETIGASGRWARRVPPITRLQEKTMSSRLNPYLSFNGNARQALEFYRSVFGGPLNINTFADFGGKDSPDADKVMHGQLETDAGYTVMAADHASNMGNTIPRLASGSA
jgi:PhnB protein